MFFGSEEETWIGLGQPLRQKFWSALAKVISADRSAGATCWNIVSGFSLSIRISPTPRRVTVSFFIVEPLARYTWNYLSRSTDFNLIFSLFPAFFQPRSLQSSLFN